ncbi:MAG TPA: hypothetical protein VN957_04485 [Chthoniobacterales bacterium]|nr:hypothetical protein [Chthoniobacterales bacterium]
MHSYISIMLEAEGAKERLERFFLSAPEVEKSDQSPRLAITCQQRRKPLVRSKTDSCCGAVGYCSARASWGAQSGGVSIEASIWIASYLLAILGLIKAAYSEQPLLWLAVWPTPIVLVCTIFVFFREGFHFRNGVLFLGRRRN